MDHIATSDMSFKLGPAGALATISSKGLVRIDWDAVERAAQDQSPIAAPLRTYAILMLAVRDDSWLPLD